MPELPEVEITARRLTQGVAGAEIESALAPGMVTHEDLRPAARRRSPASSWRAFAAWARCSPIEAGELVVLVHLMSAGRLQLYDKRASLRDRSSRLLIRIAGERELRLREFGTQQRAWAKLMPADEVEADEAVATLGPDALPPPPLAELAALLDQPRHLHPLLRDQRTIAGIGRSWVDEILWTARLSPFQRGADLDEEAVERLHAAMGDVLGAALEHYEEVIGPTVPDKLPMPLKVHRRQGEDCPRCGTRLEAIHFKDYVMSYCPEEQTGGRVLKDRRLSRLLPLGRRARRHPRGLVRVVLRRRRRVLLEPRLVRLGPLLLACVLFTAYLTLRARASYNILRAAYPDERFRFLRIWGAYFAGYGFNAVIPARGGDVVRLFLTKTSVPTRATPRCGASFVVEAGFDIAMGSLILLLRVHAGRVPEAARLREAERLRPLLPRRAPALHALPAHGARRWARWSRSRC